MKLPITFSNQQIDLANLFSTYIGDRDGKSVIELSFKDVPTALVESFETRQQASARLHEIYGKIREHYGN